MNQELLQKIKRQKEILLKDGFEIVGIFGSFVSGQENSHSDIDLLYDIKSTFLRKYGGFEAFAKINEIRERLKKELGRDVDLATIDNNSKTFKEYALKKVIYV